jgi:hypothetical protein
MRAGLLIMDVALMASLIASARFVSTAPWPAPLDLIGGICFFGWLPLFVIGVLLWLWNGGLSY